MAKEEKFGGLLEDTNIAKLADKNYFQYLQRQQKLTAITGQSIEKLLNGTDYDLNANRSNKLENCGKFYNKIRGGHFAKF